MSGALSRAREERHAREARDLGVVRLRLKHRTDGIRAVDLHRQLVAELGIGFGWTPAAVYTYLGRLAQAGEAHERDGTWFPGPGQAGGAAAPCDTETGPAPVAHREGGEFPRLPDEDPDTATSPRPVVVTEAPNEDGRLPSDPTGALAPTEEADMAVKTFAAKVRDDVRAHPGATAAEVGRRLGVPSGRAAQQLAADFAAGKLKRDGTPGGSYGGEGYRFTLVSTDMGAVNRGEAVLPGTPAVELHDVAQTATATPPRNPAIPRRNVLDENTPAEMAIRTAVHAVEELGADPRLTEIVVMLSDARERMADWVDGTQAPPHIDAATVAFDKIAALCGCAHWDYPGQLVRDVEQVVGERNSLQEKLKTALSAESEANRRVVELEDRLVTAGQVAEALNKRAEELVVERNQLRQREQARAEDYEAALGLKKGVGLGAQWLDAVRELAETNERNTLEIARIDDALDRCAGEDRATKIRVLREQLGTANRAVAGLAKPSAGSTDLDETRELLTEARKQICEAHEVLDRLEGVTLGETIARAVGIDPKRDLLAERISRLSAVDRAEIATAAAWLTAAGIEDQGDGLDVLAEATAEELVTTRARLELLRAVR